MTTCRSQKLGFIQKKLLAIQAEVDVPVGVDGTMILTRRTALFGRILKISKYISAPHLNTTQETLYAHARSIRKGFLITLCTVML
jgi:hypothetical protein